MHTETRTRNVDSEVCRLRGLLGQLVRDGHSERATEVRKELDYAKRVAAIKVAARNAPPLDPAVRDSIVALLHSAGA